MGALARTVDSVRIKPLVMLIGMTTALAAVSRARDGRYYDELLWTKANWHEYVLGFPHNDVVSKLGPSTEAFLSSIVDVHVLKDSSRATFDFAVRVEPLPSSQQGLSSSARTAISRLVACDSQTALAEILWPVVANWTLAHAAQLEDRQLVGLVNQACQVDVPVLVLRDEALGLVTVEREKLPDEDTAGGHGDGSEQAGMTQGIVKDISTYAASMVRRSQHASMGEVKAVVFGCKEVANDRWRQLMLRAQRMYLEVVRVVLDGKDGRFDKVEEADGEVAKGDSIELNRSCRDYHPQCQMWASQGECKANPKYMVGTKETGQCRLACGVCQAPEMGKIPAHLSASHAQTLEDSFTDTLLFLMEGAEDCIARYDEHGKDLKALLQMPASSHARSIADQIRGAILLENDAVASAESYPVSPDEDTTMVAAMEPLLEVETDTVAGTDTTGKPASDETGAAAPGSTTAPRVRISTFADAKIKPRYFSGGVSSDDDMSTPVEPTGPRQGGDGTLEAVKSRLDDVFHDRCVHIDVGTFWMYQFCYGLSLIQFHEQADSLVTIQLGRFLETPKSWEVVGDGPERAIVHDYSKDGAECADTGERRKALVRYLCDHSLSSDVGIRVELREPRLCQYELSVYLAELCDVLD